MKLCNLIPVTLLLALVLPPLAAQEMPEADVGYIYPAGARQGETVTVIVGGMRLRGLKEAMISGEGVAVEIGEHLAGYKRNFGRYLQALRQMNAAKKKGRWPVPEAARKKMKPEALARLLMMEEMIEKLGKTNMPMFEAARQMDNEELKQEIARLNSRDRVQQNRQIDDLMMLTVRITEDAEPGIRYIRFQGWAGVTEPLRFEVSTFPEIKEQEPNDLPDSRLEPLSAPFVLNGQILPGDTDRFRFLAKTGQRLLIQAKARELVPFLADAVPGWFQAVLIVRDEFGKEVAFCDDYRGNPDPLLAFTPPRDGVYEGEIRDSIWRGREDFVYRISVTEAPFISHIFPLGAEAGTKTQARVYGINLPGRTIALDTSPDGPPIRSVRVSDGGTTSNVVHYAVGKLSEKIEQEPNNAIKEAEMVTTPITINGRISSSDDTDWFAFPVRSGDTINVAVKASDLGSPLDSLVMLTDSKGKVYAWNDDQEGRNGVKDIHTGLQTHFADSHLSKTLSHAGTYFVKVADCRKQGSPAHAYRLTISPPQPGFRVIMSPASMTLRQGEHSRLDAYVLREGAFEGPVTIRLKDGEGFALAGATIPAGVDIAPLTIQALGMTKKAELKFVAEGRVRMKPVGVPVQPADDITQAFIIHHLVPADRFLALIKWSKHQAPVFKYALFEKLPIKAGRTHRVSLQKFRAPDWMEFKFSLDKPPEGITLTSQRFENGTYSFDITAAEDIEASKGNLIITAKLDITKAPGPNAERAKKAKMHWVDIGCLPALPYETSSATQVAGR